VLEEEYKVEFETLAPGVLLKNRSDTNTRYWQRFSGFVILFDPEKKVSFDSVDHFYQEIQWMMTMAYRVQL
jgi:hypothetical protein